MKKINLLVLIFLLGSCAQIEEVPISSLISKDGLTYSPNTQIPFTGVATSFYYNGRIEKKISFKDGLAQGAYEEYYNNRTSQLSQRGMKSIDGAWSDGVYEAWHENGELEFKARFTKGQIVDGVYTSYHMNGAIWGVETYKNGQLNGPFQIFDDKGHLVSEGAWKNGEWHGTVRVYNRNGDVEKEQIYVEGRLEK